MIDIQIIFEKIKEKLEERIVNFQRLDISEVAVDVAIKEDQRCIEIINQVAKEYEDCYKDCGQALDWSEGE